MTDLGVDARLIWFAQASEQATRCTGCTIETEVLHASKRMASLATQVSSRSDAKDEPLCGWGFGSVGSETALRALRFAARLACECGEGDVAQRLWVCTVC